MKNKSKKKLIIFKLFLLSSLCFIFLSCSSNSNSSGEYLTERPKPDRTKPSELQIELKIVNPDTSNVEGMKVSVMTSQGEQTVITNARGIAQVTVSRLYSEPVIFKFQKYDYFMTETIRTLPSDLNFAGLVFEVISPTRIKLSHYTVDGLYR